MHTQEREDINIKFIVVGEWNGTESSKRGKCTRAAIAMPLIKWNSHLWISKLMINLVSSSMNFRRHKQYHTIHELLTGVNVLLQHTILRARGDSVRCAILYATPY